MSKIIFARDVTAPKMGLMVYTKSYWVCVDGDPTRALFYGTSPQCNRNKAIVEHGIKTNLYNGWNVSVVYLETAFVPQRN